MHLQYVYMRPMRVLYARAHGPCAQACHAAWRQMLAWLEQRGQRQLVPRGIGVIHDNPNVVGPLQRRYDACVDVAPGLDVDAASFIGRQTIPGGVYAVHRHCGAQSVAGHLFSQLHREWLPAAGLQLDQRRAFLEIYLNDPASTATADLAMEICVPVLPQTLMAQPIPPAIQALE